MNRHTVFFYQREVFLINHLVQFAKAGLDKGEPLLFVTTTDHRIVLHRRLLNESVLAPFKGVYLAMDAADTLSRIMVDDWPDQDLFMKEIGDMIKLIAQRTRIRIYGEMVSVLWARGQYSAAIQLEKLWNKLATQYDFSLLCAYRSSDFEGPEKVSLRRDVCACHSDVVPATGF
jgi:hypothetical protein